jgi:hypothetical protein
MTSSLFGREVMRYLQAVGLALVFLGALGILGIFLTGIILGLPPLASPWLTITLFFMLGLGMFVIVIHMIFSNRQK